MPPSVVVELAGGDAQCDRRRSLRVKRRRIVQHVQAEAVEDGEELVGEPPDVDGGELTALAPEADECREVVRPSAR